MQSYRNNPDGEENQAATKQNCREVFASKNQQPAKTMTKHYHHTNDGSRMVITMTIPEYSALSSTLLHAAGVLDSFAEQCLALRQHSFADYVKGHANRVNELYTLIENCPQGESVLDDNLVR